MPSLQKSVGRHSSLTLSALAFHPTGNVQQVLLGPSRCRVSFWVPGYNETDKIPGSLSPQRFRGTERNQATTDNSRGPACSVVADSATPWTEVRQAPQSTGTLQARRLKWLPCPPPGESSRPGDGTRISCLGRRILDRCAIREAPGTTSILLLRL